MKYMTIDGHNKEHIKSLLKWLYDESFSAGGDGDALWYSRYFNVKDILPLVEEVNSTLKYPWKVELKDDTEIHWFDGQECVVITNKEITEPYWKVVVRC